MKLNINHTLELTDDQTVINGEARLGRDLKGLYVRALDDLAKGKTVYLAQYDLDSKLEALLASPEARKRAILIIDSMGGEPAAFPSVKVELDPPDGMLAKLEAMEQRTREDSFLGDGSDEETADIPTVRECLRCRDAAGPEEPGMCEDCEGFIHTACRAADIGELIEERGPLPGELRGVALDTGEVGPPPYLCGRCTVERLEKILAET